MKRARTQAVMSVLGCMVSQCTEKLLRFSESDALAKELQAALDKYSLTCEQAGCSVCSPLSS